MKEKGSSFSGSIGFVLAGSRKCSRSWKYLEISISLCQRWRRTFPAGLSGTGTDFWICTVDNGCSTWEKDKEKCIEGF